MFMNFLTFLGGAIFLMFSCQIGWFLFEEFMTWFGCHYGRPINKIPMYQLFGVYIEPMLDRHIFPIRRDAFFIGAFAYGNRKLVFQPWEFIEMKGWTKNDNSLRKV